MYIHCYYNSLKPVLSKLSVNLRHKIESSSLNIVLGHRAALNPCSAVHSIYG